MNKNKLDHIWDKIESDLNLSYQENNREFLIKAIRDLPNYKAPAKVWDKIEEELKVQTTVKKLPLAYKIAATITLLTGLSYFAFNKVLSKQEKIHYSKVEINSNNLYAIADTSS